MNAVRRSAGVLAAARLFVVSAMLALLLTAVPAPQHAYAAAHRCYVDAAATAPGDGLSWDTAYTNLSSALTYVDCSTVWVAQGVYKPDTTSRSVSFTVSPGVAVYGGFAGTETALSERTDPAAHPTILSGDIDNNDTNTDGNHIDETVADIQGGNLYHVVALHGAYTAISGDTLIDGFTITGGQADNSAMFQEYVGGGMLCDGNGTSPGSHLCSPTLRNLVFIGNLAGSMGGGLFNYGYFGTSSPVLSNVSFVANQASSGGGLYNFGGAGSSNPTLTDVAFSNNEAVDGAGMYNNGASGGLSSPSLERVTFDHNTASIGGALFNDASAGGATGLALHLGTFDTNHSDSAGGAL